MAIGIVIALLIGILIFVKSAADNAKSCWMALRDVKQSIDVLADRLPEWSQSEVTAKSTTEMCDKLEEIRYHLQEGKFIPGKQYPDD